MLLRNFTIRFLLYKEILRLYSNKIKRYKWR